MIGSQGFTASSDRPDYAFAEQMVNALVFSRTHPQQIHPGFFVGQAPCTYRDFILEVISDGHRLSQTQAGELELANETGGQDGVYQLPLKGDVRPYTQGLRLAAVDGELAEENPFEPVVKALGTVFKDTARFLNGGVDMTRALEVPASYQVANEAFLAGMGRSPLVTMALQKTFED